MTKEEIKNREKQIIDLAGSFCAQKLDDEYYQLCEKLILKMGRKRNVPFERGKIEIWAAAVVYAIGSINFLFDKSFKPYVSAEQLNDFFGTKNATVSNKAREIKEMFNLWHFSPEFSTKRMEESNPFNNMVMVDGLITPLSVLPENLQEEVRRARANGEDIEFYTQN